MNKDDNDRLRRLLRSEEETRQDVDPTPLPEGTAASRKPTGGTTPILNLPELDENNMPRPKRVEETDLDGTRVSNAAYRPAQETQPPRAMQGQANQRPAYRLSENQNPQQQPAYPTYQRSVHTPTFTDRLANFFGSIGSALRGNRGCFTR